MFSGISPPPSRASDSVAYDNEKHFKALLGSVGARPSARMLRYRDYFSTLDLSTDQRFFPYYLDDIHQVWAREQAVATMLDNLRSRLSIRVRTWRSQRSRAPILPPLGADDRTQATILSRVQLDVVDRFFSTRSHDIALDQFEDAFEMFANAELRFRLASVGQWAAVPSSGYFFLFAEFALTAIESDVDARDWIRLAPVMVRTQQVLVRAFSLNAYGPVKRLPVHKQFTGHEKAELARAFADCGLEELCRAHAAQAAKVF